LAKSALPIASALVIVACGRTIATSSVAQTQLAPTDAFQCVMQEFDTLRFQRTMYDKDDLRTSAKRVNPKITFSNPQFRRTWDRLDIEISAGATGTDMKVTPSTVAEYFSQTGPLYNQLQTSPEAEEAAQMLQRACRAVASPPASTAPQQ
jgi:hypothetical protein